MDQPVIVNSLLTFLRTFREHPLIERIINDHFAPKQIFDARKVIESRLGVQNISLSVKLVDLFDLADNKGILPTFAVSDLSELPMVIANQEHRKMELVRNEWEVENNQRSVDYKLFWILTIKTLIFIANNKNIDIFFSLEPFLNWKL